MIKWNRSILSKRKNTNSCWLCGSGELTREHVYKQTDVKQISFDTKSNTHEQLGLLRYKTHGKPIALQSANSTYLKFSPSLCKYCNMTRTQPFDRAYELVVSYYINNIDKIKDSCEIDFKEISEDWFELKLDFYKYCVKHVASRLVEANIQPSENLIEFLLSSEILVDIKFIFQYKGYRFEGNESVNKQIYLGPFNHFQQKHLFKGNKLTSVASWYTIRGFCMNYLYKIGEFNSKVNGIENSMLYLDRIDYSGLDNAKFNLTNGYRDYGELLELLEYYPYVGETKNIDHYNYLKHFNNTR